MTCAQFLCPNGAQKKPLAHTLVCVSQYECTKENCCIIVTTTPCPTAPPTTTPIPTTMPSTCASFTCPFLMVKKANAETLGCTHTLGCTAPFCCSMPTTTPIPTTT